MYDLGKMLKELRENKSVSMRKMANDLKEYGLNPSTSMISRWENNQASPSMDYARALSKYFGVTLDELLGLENKNLPGTDISEVSTPNNAAALICNEGDREFKKKIGKKLKYLRNRKDMPLSKLLKELNIDLETYELLEEGMANLSEFSLVKIANYYDVNVDWILGRTKVMNSEASLNKMINEYLQDLVRAKIIDDPNNVSDEVVRMLFNSFFEKEDANKIFKEYLENKDKDK